MQISKFYEDEVLTALASLDGLGIENFDKVGDMTNLLSEVRTKIATEGFCLEYFNEVEALQPKLFSTSIQVNRLTQNPSSQCQSVAVELLDNKIVNLAVAATGVVGTLAFFKLIESVGKHFQSNKFEMDLDISSERFRRSFKALKDAEDNAYDIIWESFSDIRFAFNSVTERLISKTQDDKRSNDVYRELKRQLDRKVNIFEAVSLLLLAKFCVNFEAAVQDYSVISKRLLEYPTYKNAKALTTGLAITRSGVSSKLLLKSTLGFNSQTVSDLSRLAKLIDTSCSLLANPTKLQSGERWLVEAEKILESLELDNFAALSSVNDMLLPDSDVYDTVNEMRAGRIGFWHDTEAHPQGDNVFAADKYSKEVARIFNLATIQDAVRIKDDIRRYSTEFRKAVAVSERASEKAAAGFIENYPDIKGTYRTLTNRVRNSMSAALRVSNVMINYCEGYVDMIGYSKNLVRTYEKNVPHLLGIK